MEVSSRTGFMAGKVNMEATQRPCILIDGKDVKTDDRAVEGCTAPVLHRGSVVRKAWRELCEDYPVLSRVLLDFQWYPITNSSLRYKIIVMYI